MGIEYNGLLFFICYYRDTWNEVKYNGTVIHSSLFLLYFMRL
jgi:hypothetical protein